MIPLRFYRDDKNVYYNNPDGTTKSMTIQEFEEHFSGGSGGGGGVTYFDATVDYAEQTVDCDVTKANIAGMLNSGSHPVIRFNAPEGGAKIYEPLDCVYGDNTNGAYSFQRYVTLGVAGSPTVISVAGYVLIMLNWQEEGGEMVEEWSLDYVNTL